MAVLPRLRTILICVSFIGCGMVQVDAGEPEKVAAPHLPNAYRLHEKVISGGLPEGDAAFQELQQLGVKTIISVDGATPNVAMAEKYGMRYVHLPHGYDGIPTQRGKELAKAVRDLPGPIYIHCHHGKHRSPAAATVACVAVGYVSSNDALTVLKTSGTNPHYRGLYQAARDAKRLTQEELDQLHVEFKSTAAITPLAEEMVAIEHLHDQLKKFGAIQWRERREDAAHDALLLRERFTELMRVKDERYVSEEYMMLMKSSEQDAEQLESALRSNEHVRADAALKRLSESCVACHQRFRDVPLGEK